MECRSNGVLEGYLGVKTTRGLAAPWPALVIAITKPNNPAATNALRSRAEFFKPLLLRPPDSGGQVGKAKPYPAHLPFRVSLPGAVL